MVLKESAQGLIALWQAGLDLLRDNPQIALGGLSLAVVAVGAVLTIRRQQQRRERLAGFAEFYCDLCRQAGLDYTQEEACGLYRMIGKNPELRENRVLNDEQAAEVLSQIEQDGDAA